MTKLLLDALYPPSPTQLVADLNAVGADGVFVYVWRPGGTGSWTSAHVQTLRNAGKLAVPIIVPPVDGGDINAMLGAAHSSGFTSGPITLDLEPPNLPPSSWEEEFDLAARNNGFSDFDYGTPTNLGFYLPDDKTWVATWIRTGQLSPLPTLPAGWSGWQFVNDIIINGTYYDASVIADSVFRGGSMTITDSVAPVSPVTGKTFQTITTWLNWGDLQPVVLSGVVQTIGPGQEVIWTEAKLENGVWYDRIEGPSGAPGDWCLPDAAVDDGGFDPPHFRPVSPPPAPTPSPVPAPVIDQAARDALKAIRDVLVKAGL